MKRFLKVCTIMVLVLITLSALTACGKQAAAPTAPPPTVAPAATQAPATEAPAATAAPTAAPVVDDSEPFLDFAVINQTGYSIYYLYVSPSGDSDWGEDILDVDVLGDTETVNISFTGYGETQYWDIKAIDEDGDEMVFFDIDLYSVSTVTLVYKNGEGTALTN